MDVAEKVKALPPSAYALVRTLYRYPEWRRVRVCVASAVRAGFWQHRESAAENLQALREKGLLIAVGNGKYEAVPDDALRQAIVEAVE